jgi:4-hydroxybutyrate dehydrogenase
MGPALTLPRLVFGPGKLAALDSELKRLGVSRPLLISDRGLERAGTVGLVIDAAPSLTCRFLDVPENPTALGADLAASCYRASSCDGIVALGGGSVIDTAKFVAALVCADVADASALIGKPERLGPRVAPLIAMPTTLGTGSESSPVAALHFKAGGPAIGTRSDLLVPRVALCDPDLARTLPARLVAATAIDALSHCIEGFFAEPANPVIDALALDGIARVFADIEPACQPDGDHARMSLMAAAFAGGVAIHKGLGPAHAVALACGDQHAHHGTLVGVALPQTTQLLAQHLPAKAARIRTVLGLPRDGDIGLALTLLIRNLGLPETLAASGYHVEDTDALVARLIASPFNQTSPYVPSETEYRALAHRIIA